MKIIFFHTNLNVGGIEKSLVNLANSLSKRHEIEIVLLNKSGKLLHEVNKDIKISEAESKLNVFGMSKNDSKKRGLFSYIKRNFYALVKKHAKNDRWIGRVIRKTNKTYECDVAVSYTDDMFLAHFVLEKTSARKKFIFYHSDFRNKRFKNEDYINTALKFDKYICVSKSCKDVAVKCSPKLASIADYLYNSVYIPITEEKYIYNEDFFNVLTVARVSEEKRIDWAVEIIARLIKEGYNVRYYICGGGKDFNKIKDKIAALGLTNSIFLLGEQKNPYKYMFGADLITLLSRTESFGIALIEGMLLGVPCLTTNTVSAKEVVGNYGFVCEHDKESIYLKLKEILNERKLLEEKKSLLKNFTFNNEENIKRMEKFCETDN